MIRRFRMLLPPGWVIFTAVLIYVILALPEILFNWKFGLPQQGSDNARLYLL